MLLAAKDQFIFNPRVYSTTSSSFALSVFCEENRAKTAKMMIQPQTLLNILK